jgi:hypothetical protein
LRWVAPIGLAVVLSVDLYSSLRLKTGLLLGVGVLSFFTVAVALVSLLLMPHAVNALVRRVDLLSPLALLTVASKLLLWLAALPVLGAVLSPSFPLRFFSLSFAISLQFLLSVALAVAYAAWMTTAVLKLVRTGKSDPSATLTSAMRRFWWMLALEAIGLTVLLVPVSVMIMLMPVVGFFVLLPMALIAVVWNFSSAALLPVAMQYKSGFGPALRAGLIVSIANWRKWWLLLLAQMLLLGLILFFYSHSGGSTNVSWNINAFWTGGYEDDCRWYGKLADVFHTSKLPLVETLLGLLFGAMAVAIKIAIVQRLQTKAATD